MIYHNHHIVPKHAGGSDDESNIIRLSVREHAEAHRLLWICHGRLKDKLAWLMLSGRTNEGEVVRRLLVSRGLTGRKLSSEHRANISRATKGRKKSPEHEARLIETLQRTATIRAQRISEAKKGKPRPDVAERNRRRRKLHEPI